MEEDLVVVVNLRGRSVAERLRLRRRALGLSQWDVAERLGVTQSAVSLAEHGRLRDPAQQARMEQALRELAAGAA